MTKNVVAPRVKANFRGINQIHIPASKAKACLNVSIDQKNEQGTKLQAIIEKANRTFKSIDIMLCDSLNRYNIALMHKIAIEKATPIAIATGDEWIRDNTPYMQNRVIPGRIIRWSEWLNNEHLAPILKRVRKTIVNNKTCFSIFEQVATDYFHRRNIEICTNKRAMNLAIDYLSEECAVIILWSQLGYNFELYPSTRNPAVAYLFEHIFNKPQQNVLYFLRVEFKKSYPQVHDVKEDAPAIAS